MKFIVIFAILVLVASCANDRMLFNHFKNKFNKKYSVEEEAMRFKIFQANLKTIREHNAGDSTFKMGINQFTDLTLKEYAQKYLSPVKIQGSGRKTNEKVTVGGSFNWVDHGAVTPVKDQGQCGSCWTFSTTGMIEGCTVADGGKLISLSEQEIVDCDDGGYGCNGGWPYQAMAWVTSNGGLCSEQAYPYKAYDQNCQKSSCQSVSTLNAHAQYSSETEMMNKIQTYGPISIAVDAENSAFMYYTSGVVTASECPDDGLDHAILITGYNTDANPPYWIVKNSWAASWGQQGYIWLEYGKNTCGLADQAWYGTGCHNL
ncbi:cysteine protease rdl2-related [Anaeramoeba ignava]|uniref:Cysteine protease rdl2-related n=1 Tax=Anaeramoeba ignava TaxID=1746090 RepID=A0A9Q0RD13_ANAIG|nr:cysteine protease rdl2-related [Anaeramoeba ignava]|eukprot:Anaeramoba_ignava/a478300_58051.p1 GENE.a478300_58051~~a478300_58051.p1  ORF type:complete len:317 (-),score=71.36 a478300_58051:347-1297(-)